VRDRESRTNAAQSISVGAKNTIACELGLLCLAVLWVSQSKKAPNLDLADFVFILCACAALVGSVKYSQRHTIKQF